jgi:hypothetical protein
MPEDFSPIDELRAHAEATKALPPDAPEYGLGTQSLPVSSSEDAPLVARLGSVAAAYGPLTLGRIIEDIFVIQPTVAPAEWRRFRATVGRMLGLVTVSREDDDRD